MTHSEDEEETRHVFGLLDSVIAVTGVEVDCNNFWYRWNLESSSVENWTDWPYDTSPVEADCFTPIQVIGTSQFILCDRGHH